MELSNRKIYHVWKHEPGATRFAGVVVDENLEGNAEVEGEIVDGTITFFVGRDDRGHWKRKYTAKIALDEMLNTIVHGEIYSLDLPFTPPIDTFTAKHYDLKPEAVTTFYFNHASTSSHFKQVCERIFFKCQGRFK